MRLPEDFLERMRRLLGEEYDLWLETYGQAPAMGIRINPARLSGEEWERISPWEVKRVPWNENGYYGERGSRPAKDVFYYGGLYYVQEPSAMAPAAILNVKPGQQVLDLCAAPGGKSTELGARLLGKGLLVANDISASRAKALLKNLEMAGLGNICVTAEEPKALAEAFGEAFDKILVDAPCSGEGMFRKEPELVKSWTERGPEYYVPIQREILRQAVRMLKPGGELVYSTCTFSEEEDEGAVGWILEKEPEMELVPIEPWEGASCGADKKPVIRLFPHRVWGEGHFVALLRKKTGDRRFGERRPGVERERAEEAGERKPEAERAEKAGERKPETEMAEEAGGRRPEAERAGTGGGRKPEAERAGTDGEKRFQAEKAGADSERKPQAAKAEMFRKGTGCKKGPAVQGESTGSIKQPVLAGREAAAWLEGESDFSEWERLLSEPLDRERLFVREGQVYVLPEGFDRSLRLRFLRTGLLAGSVKRGRFEPSQAMAMTLDKEAFARSFSMEREDERVIRYLKGESLALWEHEQLSKGWVLVCVDRFPLGWAKSAGSGLKNKYYPGWRWQ